MALAELHVEVAALEPDVGSVAEFEGRSLVNNTRSPRVPPARSSTSSGNAKFTFTGSEGLMRHVRLLDELLIVDRNPIASVLNATPNAL